MQRCYGCMKEYGDEYKLCPYCGYVANTLPETKNHLKAGTVLANRYILGKVLGYGGFGITYIAWDETLSRTVAIKEFFANSLASRNEGETEVYCYNKKAAVFFEEGKNKMIDEGKRLSRFSGNPNIVNVFDCFKENNTAYIVMEHLIGKDLNKHLSENFGGISPEEAVEIILPVLNALEDMHKEKMIHRDVSPDNIFLCENGTVKLLDFGSARLAVENSDKSLSIMLKRGYAPREQYLSRSKQGPWTDIYAVCATLYHMITGKKPVESTERDEVPLKSFAEMGVRGYDGLEKAVFKGMELEIGDRIQSAGELKALLEASVRKAPPPDPPQKLSIPKIPEPPKKKQKKLSPKMRNIIIAAASIAVIIAVAFAVIKFLPEKKEGGDETTTDTVWEVTENLNNASPDVIYESFLSSDSLAESYPVINAFVKKDFSLLPADEKALFDTEALNITNLSSSVVKKDFYDFDKDGSEELLLSLDINGEDMRVKTYLFDLDKNKNVIKGAEWDILAPSRTFNHLSIMTDAEGNYYFLEFESDGQNGKSCQKSVYDGKKLKAVLSLSVPDYMLLGNALPDWRKCTAEGKSLYLHGAAETAEPTNGEIEFLTYEDVCNEWEKLFSGTRITGFCDSSAEELNTRCKLVKEGKVNETVIWRYYDDRCMVVEGKGEFRYTEVGEWIFPNYFEILIIGNGIKTITHGLSLEYRCDKLVLSNTLQTINESALWGVVDEIYIPASVSYIGEKALSGMYITVDENNSVYASDGKGALLSKNKEILYQAPDSRIYAIPSGVKYVVDYAYFSTTIDQLIISDTVESINISTGPYNTINNVSVDENSSHYSTDNYGVLYNKDKTQIVFTPEKVNLKRYEIPQSVTYIMPGGLRAEEIIIPDTYTEIDTYAFTGCKRIHIPKTVTCIRSEAFYFSTLTDVYYEGTPFQWAAIEIEEGNENLTNATIHYNS
ncbi:MAG: protein kinase [Clostridia bacterium]|nr:protein kinase [Clostridia bacterium]